MSQPRTETVIVTHQPDGCECAIDPRCIEREAASRAALDVLRLAEAWFIGIQHRNGLDRKAALSRWSSPDEDMRHMRGVYLDVARIALARLTEQEERGKGGGGA